MQFDSSARVYEDRVDAKDNEGDVFLQLQESIKKRMSEISSPFKFCDESLTTVNLYGSLKEDENKDNNE